MTTAHPVSVTAVGAPTLVDGVAPIRVVIVDDCAEVRFLLATLLELDGRFEVVAEASDPDTAVAAVAATEPEVVLVDLRLRSGSGTTVIRRLRDCGSAACIVVVTASHSPRDHEAARAAGADEVLDKVSMTSTMVEDLVDLVAGHPVPQSDNNVRTTEGSHPPARPPIGR